MNIAACQSSHLEHRQLFWGRTQSDNGAIINILHFLPYGACGASIPAFGDMGLLDHSGT